MRLRCARSRLRRRPRWRCARAGGGGRHEQDAARRVPVAETGFDPQATSATSTRRTSTRAIFDPLYRYDYLARPFRIVPNTAAAMPEISADGRTWTIRVRPGIHFADDPGVQGQEARADRRRLRLFVEAPARSRGCARRTSRSIDRPLRRRRRGAGGGEGGGQARLRRAVRRRAARSTATRSS